MTEIIMSWPWYDRAIVGALIATLLFAHWTIAKELARIRDQNDRIIGFLLDIKIGRRD